MKERFPKRKIKKSPAPREGNIQLDYFGGEGPSTHLMSYGKVEIDGKIKYAAHPTLFQTPDGRWYKPNNPFEVAKELGEVITFNSEKRAAKYADGSWKPKLKKMSGGGPLKVGNATIYGVNNMEDYRNAYNQNRVVRYNNDGELEANLKPVEIVADKTTKQQYPYYNTLTAEEVNLLKSPSPLGQAARSKAVNGETVNKQGLTQIIRDFGNNSAEISGIPGLVRFGKDPGTSLTGAGNTLADFIAFSSRGMTNPTAAVNYAVTGTNPFTGEKPFRQEDLLGAFNTLDAAGFATMAGAAFKVPMQQGFKQTGKYLTRQTGNVVPVVNTAINLEDLKAAQQFAQQYGYELPTNIERIAQSNQLTDRTIRGMMDRHNTFVRGVSTNWDELGKRNPEILRHLEGKGFDLSTKEGTQASAEYMATHIPINTGYGRASLDRELFGQGLDGLYSSNSIPTGEGYTYGQGYITKVKRPTNYSSSNRQDWISQNNPKYIDEDNYIKLNYYNTEFGDNMVKALRGEQGYLSYKNLSKEEKIKQLKYRAEVFKKSSGYDVEYSKQIDADLNKLIDNIDGIQSKYIHRLLRTERSNLPTDPFDFLIKKEGDAKKLSEWLKTQPYQQKMREMNDLGESLSKYTWEQQKPIRDKIDILKKEANEMYNQSVQDYMKVNHPDYDPVNRYAHYIHLGTPGEKVLQPIKSWEITPEIWKNKSRSHTNKYSKKFSAMSMGGMITPPAAIGAGVVSKSQQNNTKQYKKGGKLKYAQGGPIFKNGGSTMPNFEERNSSSESARANFQKDLSAFLSAGKFL